MSTGDGTDSNPFADPSVYEEQPHYVDDSTLSVGRNASLTLGTDSLIVLGKAQRSCYIKFQADLK